MKKQIIAIILSATTMFNVVMAQNSSEISPLSIGDPMSDIVISNLKNYPKDEVNISDFKGKLLILDFWATWCPTCYEYFPKLDMLQKEFDNQVQIILVNPEETKDTKDKIANLFLKLKENVGYEVKLPFVNHDPVLGKLFPFRTLPQYIWIDSEGKVRAVTDILSVTSENIRHLLQGGFLHNKQDIYNYDRSKPFAAELFERKEVNRKYRSQITGYIEGISGYNSFGTNGTVRERRVYRSNMRLKMLLTLDRVFDELRGDKVIRNFPNSQIIFKTTNPKFESDFRSADSFNPDELYTYEILLPDTLPFTVVRDFMREDLSRYFNFNIKREERKVPVYVLKSTPRLAKIESTFDVVKEAVATAYYKTRSVHSMDKNASKKYLKNATIEQLINVLNNFSQIPILSDEVFTHQSQRYDFDFPNNLYELTSEQLKEYLLSYGFEVAEKERLLPIVTFTDRY
ncbi:TlpA family protein disulfide reductase [Sphingobacterium yanglingense]|uniref:Thiol-disulfide isomerase/thioredoxin n=1 Tax=Sphingobacterium yanglingense TaxID=1437280 RepID=A0A4R6WGL2_9SPHI|nr:TlpA disulfide reductase family protein [Sphingobacterium yanglingense]TDQ79300.1 thiol-disulfide isomerase/thioredoxin [Sphingobacterium yanglingense]